MIFFRSVTTVCTSFILTHLYIKNNFTLTKIRISNQTIICFPRNCCWDDTATKELTVPARVTCSLNAIILWYRSVWKTRVRATSRGSVISQLQVFPPRPSRYHRPIDHRLYRDAYVSITQRVSRFSQPVGEVPFGQSEFSQRSSLEAMTVMDLGHRNAVPTGDVVCHPSAAVSAPSSLFSLPPVDR